MYVSCNDRRDGDRRQQGEWWDGVLDENGFFAASRRPRHDVGDDDLEDGEAEDERDAGRDPLAAVQRDGEAEHGDDVDEDDGQHDVAHVEDAKPREVHVDVQDRVVVVVVDGFADARHVPLSVLRDDVHRQISSYPLHAGHGVVLGGDGEVAGVGVEREVDED